MKKNRIPVVLLFGAALMLSACQRENNFEDISFEDDEVMFKIASVQTRSAAEVDGKILDIATVNMKDAGTLILQDEVTSMDQGIVTRGTPAFTENVKDLYGTFNTVALLQDGTAAFAKNSDIVNGVEYTNERDNIWHYRYGENIWGEDGDKLPTYFFMRMPGTANGVTLGDSPYDIGTGSISFSYTSPESASNQQDILFTSYTRTEKTNAEDITFYHALTGVKFANYFDNTYGDGSTSKTVTIIKSVTISGLKNSGNCVVTPSAGKSSDASVWSNLSGSATFTQSFCNDTTFAEYGSTYGLDENLNSTAAKQNLNDEDGTLTFWFIPQDLTKTSSDSVTLKVVFDVKQIVKGSDGTETSETTFENKELEVTLSTKLNEGHREWKAGQLHTFTLRPTAVGVKIEDKLTDDTKSDVVVQNTGNVWQYVRVNIVGNWVGKVCIDATSSEESATLTYSDTDVILMGYPNKDKDANGEYTATKMVNPWNDKDFYSDGSYREVEATSIYMSPYTGYGTFKGLPYMADEPADGQQAGPGGDNGNGWIRHDKYYYYKSPIGPGDSVTDHLFDSYVVGTSPAFWIADKWGTRRPAKNVHLEMDLAVQAIECPVDKDGNPTKTYLEAWTDILNNPVSDKFNINDL